MSKFIVDHDYHIHSYLSACSKDELQTPKRILEYAKKNNYKKICITDHMWDSKRVEGYSKWYFNQSFEHIQKNLPLPVCDNIHFYFGAETDFNKDMTLGISKESLEKLDFCIIPINHFHMAGFTISKEDADSIDRRRILFCERFNKIMDMDLPHHKTGIAHFTCTLLDNRNFENHLLILDGISDEVFGDMFAKMAQKGAGLELNFNLGEYISDDRERVLRPYRIAQRCGCKFYFGSDAHHPNDLDSAFENFINIRDALDLKEEQKFSFV